MQHVDMAILQHAASCTTSGGSLCRALTGVGALMTISPILASMGSMWRRLSWQAVWNALASVSSCSQQSSRCLPMLVARRMRTCQGISKGASVGKSGWEMVKPRR